MTNKIPLFDKIVSRLSVVPPGLWLKHLGDLIELRTQPDAKARAAYQAFMRQREGMNVTTNWLGAKSYFWLKHLSHLTEVPFEYLEIGSWEGTSACFAALNYPKAHITCVDSWQGAEDAKDVNSEGRFDQNTAFFKDRLTKLKGLSQQMIAGLQGKKMFDVIYVDAAHYADDVMADALLCWPLLKKGGYMIFDDFVWGFTGFPQRKWTNFAIRQFLDFMRGEYKLLVIGHQVIIQRTMSRDELVRPV